jgi:Fe-S-cluster-containing dehydrogenase component
VYCCPTGASHVEDFGKTVQVTANRCIGCKACVAACPYGARFINPKGYADKCTFCMHRVKEGKDPACVSVCPTRCMYFGDLDDPKSQVNELLRTRTHHTLLPEAGTKPRVYYLT